MSASGGEGGEGGPEAVIDPGAPPGKFPKCWPLAAVVKWCRSRGRTMKTPKPKQWTEQEIAVGRAGPAGRWSIEDRRGIGPPRRISQADGASERNVVEEVAAVSGAANQRGVRTVSYSPKPLPMSRMSRSAASVLRP